MGAIRLGCLLGQAGGAQSFDVDSSVAVSGVGSWFKGGSSSWSVVGSASSLLVHSSARSLRMEVFSHAGSEAQLRYAYGWADDAHARWYPEVTTHSLEAMAWWLVEPVGSSGDLAFRLRGDQEVQRPLPGLDAPVVDGSGLSRPAGPAGAAMLQFQYLSTSVTSQGGGLPAVEMGVAAGTRVHSHTIVLVDDVLTVVDGMTLQPDWSFQERAALVRHQHRTSDGRLHTLVWGQYFAYTVPLRYLSDSAAGLINWWWQRQDDLLLTLDTSDAAARYITRIVNPTQPIGRRVRPYGNLWQGRLQLESVNNGGLVR